MMVRERYLRGDWHQWIESQIDWRKQAKRSGSTASDGKIQRSWEKRKDHPFPDWFIKDVVALLAKVPTTDRSIKAGQPFRLGLMKYLLQSAGHPDYAFMAYLAEALVLGVEEVIQRSPGVWPPK